MKRLTALALAGILSIAGAAHAQSTIVDGSYRSGSVRWTGGTPAKFVVAWKFLRTADGGTAVCGAWSLSDLTASRGAQGLLRGGVVLADGEPIHRNLSQFKRNRAQQDGLDGAEARCIPLTIPANTSRLDIDLGSGRFRY